MRSARISDKTSYWMECIHIIIHVYLFFRCKKCNVLYNPSSSQQFIDSFRCNIESKHLLKNIPNNVRIKQRKIRIWQFNILISHCNVMISH